MSGVRRYKVACAPLVVRDVHTPRTTVAVDAMDAREAKFAALRRVLDNAGLYDHAAADCLSCARIVWVERDLEIA